MKAQHLVIAVALPAVALAAGVSASMSGQHHHQLAAASSRQQGGALPRQQTSRHRGDSSRYRAVPDNPVRIRRLAGNPTQGSRTSGSQKPGGQKPRGQKHSRPRAESAGAGMIVNSPANIDYAAGGYGAYDSDALHHWWVQGVIINLDWSRVEPRQGKFNWGPLDREAAAWANAGKHVALVVRATNEIRGGCTAGEPQFLPSWEIRALHNALGFRGTFCDRALNSLIPDWFSGTFQTTFKRFIRALGAHVSAKPYRRSISYVRIGVGLAGEGFFLRPHQNGYYADKRWMETNWHYTPRAWERFQETMLSAYDAAFPAPIQVIYPIDAQDNLSPHNPVELAVAKWATGRSGIGVGEECLRPGGFNLMFSEVLHWVRYHHHGAYIQFQTCGVTASAAEERGIVKAAERYGAKTIEWYEHTAVRPPARSYMAGYQTWVNNHF